MLSLRRGVVVVRARYVASVRWIDPCTKFCRTDAPLRFLCVVCTPLLDGQRASDGELWKGFAGIQQHRNRFVSHERHGLVSTDGRKARASWKS